MKPVCVGCMWPDGNEINDVLRRFEACLLVDGPSISISTPIDDDIQTGETTSLQADTGYRPAMYVPEEGNGFVNAICLFYHAQFYPIIVL